MSREILQIYEGRSFLLQKMPYKILLSCTVTALIINNINILIEINIYQCGNFEYKKFENRVLRGSGKDLSDSP